MTDTKMCTRCELPKSIVEEFGKNPRGKNGIKAWCRSCETENSKLYRHKNIEVVRVKAKVYARSYRKVKPHVYNEKDRASATRYSRKHPEVRMFEGAKARAKKQKVPFSISVTDINIPMYCPILGIELKRGVGKVTPNSPSLDKIIPSKGYVPGNISVISMRANQLKNNSSIEELEKILEYMKQHQ